MTDRHDKWVPVYGGHVIPVGQPYRTEFIGGNGYPEARERIPVWEDVKVPSPTGWKWFVDSSWRPPLELPTEPTWGIVLGDRGPMLGRWVVCGDYIEPVNGTPRIPIAGVRGFVPLSDQQLEQMGVES